MVEVINLKMAGFDKCASGSADVLIGILVHTSCVILHLT